MQAAPLPADGTPSTEALTAPSGPALIDGAPELLWSGVGAVVAVFVLVFWLLARWKARHRLRETQRDTDFFKPAGAGAEISFEDAAPDSADAGFDGPEAIFDAPAPPKKRGVFSNIFNRRDREEAVIAEPEDLPFEDGGGDQFASVEIDYDDADERPVAPAQDWSAIEREEDDRAAARRADEGVARRLADERETRRLADEREMRRLADEGETRRLADEEAARQRAAEDARRRIEAEDFAALRDAASRLEEDDRERAALETARAADFDKSGAHDDLVRTLSEVEEALHVQREAIQAETRTLLDSFARRFSDRLDSLAASVEQRQAQHFADATAHRSDRIETAGALDAAMRRIDERQEATTRAITALAERIDRLSHASDDAAALRTEMALLRQSLGGRAGPSAPVVQLADIVRDALSPDAYQFNAVLPNRRRADCLINMARPPGPIAIDAHFPVEAFDALAVGGPDAEAAFRRTGLRHVVSVAEALISPGVTADCALMFIPSESMATTLYARFPDIVQDSYRARVFIVSPTTLMATLHTLSGVMPGAARTGLKDAGRDEAQRALAEIERLSARIAALEGAGPAPKPVTRPASQSEQTSWRSDAAPEDVPENAIDKRLKIAAGGDDFSDTERFRGDLHTDERNYADDEDRAARERAGQVRPLFPLR